MASTVATVVAKTARVIVVSGANRGIGLEICKGLASTFQKSYQHDQLRIVLGSRDVPKGLQASKLVEEAARKANVAVSVDVQPLDLQSSASIAAFSSSLADRYGRCDVLINNAGIYENGWNKDLFERIMQTNVIGTLDLTDRLLPLLQRTAALAQENKGYRPRIVFYTSGLGALNVQSASLQRWLQDPARSLQDLRALRFDTFSTEPLAKNGTPVYNFSKALDSLATVLLQQQLDTDDAKALGSSVSTSAADAKSASTSSSASAKASPKCAISVIAVNPGWCSSEMGGAMAPRSPLQGADSAIWLSNLDNAEVQAFNGKVVYDRKIEQRWPNLIRHDSPL